MDPCSLDLQVLRKIHEEIYKDDWSHIPRAHFSATNTYKSCILIKLYNQLMITKDDVRLGAGDNWPLSVNHWRKGQFWSVFILIWLSLLYFGWHALVWNGQSASVLVLIHTLYKTFVTVTSNIFSEQWNMVVFTAHPPLLISNYFWSWGLHSSESLPAQMLLLIKAERLQRGHIHFTEKFIEWHAKNKA